MPLLSTLGAASSRGFRALLSKILYTRTNTTVVAQTYGLGTGRKTVVLKNGWLVSGAFQSSSKTYFIYKSVDGGGTWTQLCSVYYTSYSWGYFTLSTADNIVHLMLADYNESGSLSMSYFKIDPATQTNINIQSTRTFVGTLTSLGGIDSVMNSAGTEIHVGLSASNVSYASSRNVFHCKATISSGTVTWGSLTQLTTDNNPNLGSYDPAITLRNDNNPLITYVKRIFASSVGNEGVFLWYYDGSTWNQRTISEQYKTASAGIFTSVHDSPTVVTVPSSINSLTNGRIWLSFSYGGTSTAYEGGARSTGQIKVTYSDDSGNSWATVSTIYNGDTNSPYPTVEKIPTITYNKFNEIFVVWQGNYDGIGGSKNCFNLRKIKNSSGTWGSSSLITSNTNAITNYPYANTVRDNITDFTEPLFTFTDWQNSKVGFYGTFYI